MGKRFRVAYSFAGEKRAFVSAVADILATKFGKDAILCDKCHQGGFSRPGLAFCLPKLYAEEADLVVDLFSKEYEAKGWCGLEWRAMYSLVKRKNDSGQCWDRYWH